MHTIKNNKIIFKVNNFLLSKRGSQTERYLGNDKQTCWLFPRGSGSPEEMMLRWEMLIDKALSTWLDQDEGLGVIKLSGQYGVYYYRKVNLQGYKVSHCCPMPLNEGRRAHVEVTDSRPL